MELTGLALAAMGAMIGGVPDGRPITLATEATGNGIAVEVIGAAQDRTVATYTLEVSGGGNGNRSVQSGVARLEPGRRVTLLRAQLGGSKPGSWNVRLHVVPEGERTYDISASL